MLVAQQIIDGFHRIESFDRHFYKDCVPIRHSTVPQSGKFERFQLFSVFRLDRNKAGLLIDEIGQMEFLSFVIF